MFAEEVVMPRERRRHRSPETLKAIRYHLGAVAERLHALAVFVADEDGILIGACESAMDNEALAAWSSLPMKLDAIPGEQMRMVRLMKEFDGYQVALRQFHVDGFPCTLGVVSAAPMTQESRNEADRAITGVIRILDEPGKA